MAVRATVGSYVRATPYQQRPAPPGGNILKREWWKLCRQVPKAFDVIVQSWDCAFKDHKDDDYVVGQVWDRKEADKYLLDPSIAPWIHDFIEECTASSKAPNDNWVDAMTQALIKLGSSGWQARALGKKPSGW